MVQDLGTVATVQQTRMTTADGSLPPVELTQLMRPTELGQLPTAVTAISWGELKAMFR